MSIGRYARAAVFAVALIIVALFGIRPAAQAQSIPAPAVDVTRDEAVAEFPKGITFALTATAAEPIERVDLLYAAGGDRTLNLVSPPIVSSAQVNLAYDLDLGARYLPPGLDIEYRWRLVFADDRSVETEPKRLLWSDTRFDWSVLVADGVEVHAYGGDSAFHREVLDSARRTVDRLTAEYGLTSVDPIRIWLYASSDDFAGAQAPNSEPWIAGTAYVSFGLILLVLPSGNAAELGRTVPHEVAHQVIHQVTANPFNDIPTWLDEGLAVRYQETPDPSFPVIVRQAAAEGRLDSVRSLNSSFPYDQAGAVLAYAESLSLVEFIAAEFGEEGLRALVQVFDDGIAHEQGVVATLGISVDELDRRWRTSAEAAVSAPLPIDAVRRTGDRPGLGTDTALTLASGALVMALVALLGIGVATVAVIRSRRPPEDEDPPAWFPNESADGSPAPNLVERRLADGQQPAPW